MLHFFRHSTFVYLFDVFVGNIYHVILNYIPIILLYISVTKSNVKLIYHITYLRYCRKYEYELDIQRFVYLFIVDLCPVGNIHHVKPSHSTICHF